MPNGALPPFDLAEGGLLLAFVRSLSVMALFSAYGTLVFRAVVAPPAYGCMAPDAAAGIDRRLCRLILASIGVDAIALIVWLALEAGILADATTLQERLAAIGPVLETTVFGHVVLLQLAGALAMALVPKRHLRLAAAIGAAATLLEVGHSHAIAMDCDPILLASDGLHLLCAGAWLGGLLPLLLLVRAAPPRAGALAARWFSPLGKLCLYGLVATAAWQGWELLGGVPGLLGTGYGWMALGKAALFAALFGFAWINRYRFAPALLGDESAAAKRVLVRSIAVQTGFGLVIVVAAGILSSLPPGLHTQPVWPFPVQPSLVTIREDADFRLEAIGAVLALGGAALILAIGIVIRRLRWPAVALAMLIAWFAAPHLDLLFVEAYPTSFYRSPTGFAATSIAQGAGLYPTNCAACHGAEGRGDGPEATGLPVPPADLTADHLWGHTDGELFWWLSHGIDAPTGGGLAMPGFADRLSEDQRWALIDYIRAHNAGLAHAMTGSWPTPVQAPELSALCSGKTRLRLADLHGKAVRIVFAGDGPAIPPQDGIEVATIMVPPEEAAGTPSGCVAADPAVRTAYAAVAGTTPEALAGQEFLVDPNGWLRLLAPLGSDGDATDPQSLLAEIDAICRHPIESQGEPSAHHHHP